MRRGNTLKHSHERVSHRGTDRGCLGVVLLKHGNTTNPPVRTPSSSATCIANSSPHDAHPGRIPVPSRPIRSIEWTPPIARVVSCSCPLL